LSFFALFPIKRGTKKVGGKEGRPISRTSQSFTPTWPVRKGRSEKAIIYRVREPSALAPPFLTLKRRIGKKERRRGGRVEKGKRGFPTHLH